MLQQEGAFAGGTPPPEIRVIENISILQRGVGEQETTYFGDEMHERILPDFRAESGVAQYCVMLSRKFQVRFDMLFQEGFGGNVVVIHKKNEIAPAGKKAVILR